MNLAIHGICGRMGMAILRIMLERGHTLAGAFDSESSGFFGSDAGRLIGSEDLGITVTALTRDALEGADGIIDFTLPAGTLSVLDKAVEGKVPLVIGTTGLSDDDKKAVENAAGQIPILFSPNMSVGVNVLFKLTEIASSVLDSGYDVEIFEAHHRFKKDAPSGTAMRLVEAVKNSKKSLKNAREVTGRSGNVGEREDDEIGVFAMRGGDIVGEHTVFFTAMGERLELTHRATNRDILARGAVTAMEFLSGKGAGLYSMYDVLGF